MRGLVSEVNVVPVRAFLTVEALTGGLTLTVTEGAPFAVAGARAVLAGQTYGIDSMLPGAGEDDPDVLVLDSPVVAGAEEGEPVDALPKVEATTAVVTFPDGSVIEDVAVGRNDQGQTDLAPGSYEGDDRPTVEVEFRNGQHEVTWVEGRGQIDSSFINPPVPVQPASSPEPTVTGLPRQFLIRIPGVENATPVLYEYHATRAGYTGPTLLAPATTATIISVSAMGDGTAFDYDLDYTFWTVATSGGLAANPSNAVVRRLNPLAAEDFAAGSITSDALATRLVLTSLLATAEAGARVEIDAESNSIAIYESSGALKVKLDAVDVYLDARRAFVRSLETGGARLRGLTEFAPDGSSLLSSGRVQRPALMLEHKSVSPIRSSIPGGAAGRIFREDGAAAWWRVGVRDGNLFARRNSTTGGSPVTLEATLAPVNGGGAPHGADINGSFLYVVNSAVVRAFGRPTADTFAAPADAPLPAAPGTGGYAAGEPVLGLQRTTGDVLLAHRVQGAQTIGGQSYAAGEVMVRRYTPAVAGAALTLTLNKTIKSDHVGNAALTSVGMDNTSGMFDLAAVSGSTGMWLSARQGGLGSFNHHFMVRTVPDTGATVTAGTPVGAWAWHSNAADPLGLSWAAGSPGQFWSTDTSGDAIRNYTSSEVSAGDTFHGYTYVNGTQESEVAPLFGPTGIFVRLISQWNIPPLPPGISQVRIYAGADSARTRLERVGTFTGTSGEPLLVEQNSIQPPAGTATNPPPATSDLTAGAPHELYTEAGGTYIRGDGKAGSTVALTDNSQWTNKAYVDGPAWLEPTNYRSGVVQRAANPVAYRYHLGYLELTGSVGTNSVAANTTIDLFNIDAPGIEKVISAVGGSGFHPGRIIITAAGVVQWNNGHASSASTLVYFDGIRIKL